MSKINIANRIGEDYFKSSRADDNDLMIIDDKH